LRRHRVFTQPPPTQLRQLRAGQQGFFRGMGRRRCRPPECPLWVEL